MKLRIFDRLYLRQQTEGQRRGHGKTNTIQIALGGLWLREPLALIKGNEIIKLGKEMKVTQIRKK